MTMEQAGIHPAVVHFPIVLLVAALLLDAVGLVAGRRGPSKAGRWALWLGTVAAGVGVWSGHEASDGVRAALAPPAAMLMARHHDLAIWTLAGAGLLSVWRLVARDDAAIPWRLAYLIVSLALVAQLALTAHLGGRLVFDYGVGVGTG